MHLSLLSDGYVSDSFDDARPIVVAQRRPPTSIHFVALCRGIVVLLALAMPVGLTLLAR
jgi:hypothetical protein